MTANVMNTAELDKLVLPFNSRCLSCAVCILQLLFYVTLITVMISGAGELSSELTGIPKWIMCAAASLLTAVAALFGTRGAAAIFRLCVPSIAVASVVFAVAALCLFDGINYLPSENYDIIPQWLAAAITYASYNSFACVGVICPFAVSGEYNRRTLLGGTALGAGILALISAAILTVLYMYPHTASHGMPMLAAAYAIAPSLGVIYGILLFMGLMQSAVSGMVACNTYMLAKLNVTAEKRRTVVAIVGVLVFALSRLDFSWLIRSLYPVFGYINALLATGMLANFLRLHRRMRKNG